MEPKGTKSGGRISLALAAGIVLLLGSVVLAAPTAQADKCKSEDHAACNSHDCPRDGQKHKHVHNVHWWRDHGCERDPSCCAALAAEPPRLAGPSPAATLPCVQNPVFQACIEDGALYWDAFDFTPPGPAPPPFDALDRGFDCVFFELDPQWCSVLAAAFAEDPEETLLPPVVYVEGRLVPT